MNSIEFKFSFDTSADYKPNDRIYLSYKGNEFIVYVDKLVEDLMGTLTFKLNDQIFITDPLPLFNGNIFNVLIQQQPATNQYFTGNIPIFYYIYDILFDLRWNKTGWPMEYTKDMILPTSFTEKENIIVFPHRIAPEKQVEIFRDLAESMPQYEFIVCQDQTLTKTEYHNILGQAKIVFSCSLQETLGIGCYEGAIVDAVPLVPDRLSYTEMYDSDFKYPSDWTKDYPTYLTHKSKLMDLIRHTITNYEQLLPKVSKLTQDLTDNFFSAGRLLDNIR